MVTSETHNAIQDVMLNYTSGLDDREFERYAGCFADDLEVIGYSAGAVQGKQAWLDFAWPALEVWGATQHLLSPMRVEMSGEHAFTRTDFQALHVAKEDGGEDLVLWGTYFSRMRCEDGAWQIFRHEMVRRRMRRE